MEYATKEAEAYPVLLVTYEIVCCKGKDPAKAKLLKAFLKSFASSAEQTKLQDTGYTPPRDPDQGSPPPSTPSPDPATALIPRQTGSS